MKVKIVCDVCSGHGCVIETEWETEDDILCVCPACNGKGYVLAEKYEGAAEEERE